MVQSLVFPFGRRYSLSPERGWNANAAQVQVAFIQGRSVKRQFFILSGALVLSVAGFAFILAVWRLLPYLVLTYIPRLVHTPAQTNFSILAIMMIVVAALAAGFTSAHSIHLQRRQIRGERGFRRMRFHH